jgi:co-chaperonin GroES (HSP10)
MQGFYDIAGTEEAAKKASQLPKPCGFHLLVALPRVSEKTEGGIIRPDELRSREETAAVVGYVMEMGPDCYKDQRLFSVPWCAKGDWVVFRPYSGIRLVVHGQEFRILKDNEVSAVVQNPAGVIRSTRA